MNLADPTVRERVPHGPQHADLAPRRRYRAARPHEGPAVCPLPEDLLRNRLAVSYRPAHRAARVRKGLLPSLAEPYVRVRSLDPAMCPGFLVEDIGVEGRAE